MCRLAVFGWLTLVAWGLSVVASTPTHAARPDDPVLDRPVPKPQPATPRRATPPVPVVGVTTVNPASAQAARLKRIGAVRSWGYQLVSLKIEEAASAPFDLLIVDATTGHADGRAFTADEIKRLKRKPDGSPRMVVSYVSIGEAEDYRPDYFAAEYLTEDAPDWLAAENPQWKGNRVVRFCHEGWQRTILGDDQGRNVYNSIDPSPLYRLIELGFDGIYLDRVDVYSEVRKDCPDGEKKMVDFVARLGAHARKRDPGFLVILQNAEELVRHPRMMDTIDAIAKEDLFYGADHSQNANPVKVVGEALGHLKAVKAAGRPVLVIDYVLSGSKKADVRKRIEEHGFIPYIGPRDLGRLWLPGRDF